MLECVDYLSKHHHPHQLLSRKGTRGGASDDHVRSKLAMSGGGAGTKGVANEDEPVVKSKLPANDAEKVGVFWKTLRAGLTASSWTTRYKTSR